MKSQIIYSPRKSTPLRQPTTPKYLTPSPSPTPRKSIFKTPATPRTANHANNRRVSFANNLVASLCMYSPKSSPALLKLEADTLRKQQRRSSSAHKLAYELELDFEMDPANSPSEQSVVSTPPELQSVSQVITFTTPPPEPSEANKENLINDAESLKSEQSIVQQPAVTCTDLVSSPPSKEQHEITTPVISRRDRRNSLSRRRRRSSTQLFPDLEPAIPSGTSSGEPEQEQMQIPSSTSATDLTAQPTRKRSRSFISHSPDILPKKACLQTTPPLSKDAVEANLVVQEEITSPVSIPPVLIFSPEKSPRRNRSRRRSRRMDDLLALNNSDMENVNPNIQQQQLSSVKSIQQMEQLLL